MADGVRKEAWVHTSHLLALTFNLNRDPKSPAMLPQDFNPFAAQRPKSKPIPISMAQFRDVWMKTVGGQMAPASEKTTVANTKSIPSSL